MTDFPDPKQRKSELVQNMFDRIAHRYDLLNHLLSLQIDKYWRKKAILRLEQPHYEQILDLASGTGDLAVTALKRAAHQGFDCHIIGVDFSFNMLAAAQKTKFSVHQNRYTPLQADAQRLPFADAHFTAAMIAFGIRNVENIRLAISECYRILKPGSRFIVLEFSQPNNKFVASVYNFYFNKILPVVGKLISGDSAYSYLPVSVAHFPDRQSFCQWLLEAGFENIGYLDLSFGISTIFYADKNGND